MKRDRWLGLGVAALLVAPMRAQETDGRGPIAAYPGQVRVSEAGVSLGSAPVPGASNEVWNPRWITLPPAGGERAKAIRFRRELAVPSGFTLARALVTADPYYRLWVNGVLVSRGPDDAGNDFSPHDRWSHRWLANRVDLTPYLHAGTNVLAAEVFAGRRGSFSLGTAAFAMRLTVEGATSTAVETGDDWWVQSDASYGTGPGSMQRYDARLDDPLWRATPRKDDGWQRAVAIPSIWGPVRTSALPPAMEAVWPVQQVAAIDGAPAPKVDGADVVYPGDGRFEVDYDRVLSGYVSLSVEGSPGTVVTVWPRELRSSAKGRRPVQVVLGEGVTRFEPPTMESFSTLEIDVQGAKGPVRFRDIRATFVSQPVSYRGSFESSDPALNRLWLAARWQTQLCLQDKFLDSPDHQEPIGDPGDYLIEARVADDAFGGTALTPQFLREFAAILDRWMEDHPTGAVNFHTSYSLLWLQALLQYYDATGDTALAKELAPSAFRLLARYSEWIGPNGLLSEAPNYLFMDWVTIAGFNAHHPPAAIGQGYLSAFYYRGLEDGIRLAELTGDGQRVKLLTRQRVALHEAFSRELWDAKAGLYRDGKPFLNHNPTSANLLPRDREVETHSPQVNALAVLYGLAPKELEAGILERALAPDPSAGPVGSPLARLNVQPYFMHFVFAAEVHARVFSRYAPSQLHWWTVDPQTRTFPEMWTSGDWSHGWGGTPLIQMSEQVLGVQSGAPGFRTVRFAPTPLGLRFARGAVPTVRGDVAASWSEDGNRFEYAVTLPAETAGVIDLSGVGAGGYVRVDGGPSRTYDGPLTVGAGVHRVLYSGFR